jgi:diaminohydroxyphosphoribosylaminopyrimidine deaminase/5-amino-6-(5-phosphoribosylamino)uracil reductase
LELKLALSLDHRMADATGNSTWITGEEARAEVHRLRAAHDAIAIGIRTVIADDPLLTVRGAIVPRKPPIRIVFDRRLRLPLSSRLMEGIAEAPVWIVTAPDAPTREVDIRRGAGAELIPAPDLPGAMTRLRERGITSIFCEGGAELAGALLRADLVDRLTLFQAPFFLGEGGADPFRSLEHRPLSEAHRWSPVRRLAIGQDTLISLDR